MKYLTTILIAIAAIFPLVSHAQDNTTPIEALAFTLKCARDNWEITGEFDTFSQGYTEQTSKTTAGNSYWKAEYFGNSSSRGDIWCGSKNWNVNARIFNESPIRERISRIEIYTTVNSTDDISKLSGPKIYISSDIEMTNPVVIGYEGEKKTGYWQLILDDPKPDMFYSLNYDIAKSKKEAVISINRIDFYRQLSPTPLINKIYNAEDKLDHIEVLSEIGDLHLIVNEYDLNGNHIREIVGPNTPAQNAITKAAPEYADNWTNPVAAANTAYVVNLPTDANRMIQIRAKSVNDGTHSQESSAIFTDAGIETGIQSISDITTDESPIYYNMQGIRVSKPTAPGLYLRIHRGSTTKIQIN